MEASSAGIATILGTPVRGHSSVTIGPSASQSNESLSHSFFDSLVYLVLNSGNKPATKVGEF